MTALTPPAWDAGFAQTYAEARHKFLAAAAQAGLSVHTVAHPLLGHEGETLAVDAALDGPANAAQLLLISSGCHGVEGFGGSGVQVALLQDAATRAAARAAGVSLLYLHALNPHGFSWGRRVTEDGVDLNRNFADFSQALPANPAYDALAPLLLPEVAHWPPPADNDMRLFGYAMQHGERAFQQAVSGGQYQHPQGLFYGGRAPTWSQQVLRMLLQQYGRRCQDLAWIDLHTGLGPKGHGEKILACREDPDTVARARRWWGDEVTSTYDGSSTSTTLSGLIWQAVYDECPQARITSITLEYGTEPALTVLQALRADHWLHRQVGQPAEAAAIRRHMRDAFYTDTPAWKAQVAAQGLEVVQQAIAGLTLDGQGASPPIPGA